MTFKKIADILVVAAMALFIIAFPLGNKASILLLWFLVVSSLVSCAVFRKAAFHPVYGFLLVLLALRMGNLAFNPNVRFPDVEQSLSFFVIPFCFSLCTLTSKQLRVLLCIAYYTCVCFAALMLFRFVSSAAALKTDTLSAVLVNPKPYCQSILTWPLWYHPSFISIPLVFAIPLAFVLHFDCRLIKKVVAIVGIALVVCAVYLTGSRAGIVIAIALLLLSLAFYFKKTLWLHRLAMGLLAVGMVLCTYFSSLSMTSDPIRAQLRSVGAYAFKQHPWFGSGAYSMKSYLQSDELAQQLGYAGRYDFGHFHNQFLDELVQFGVVGTIPLFALFIYLCVLAIRKRDFMLASFLAVYILFCNVESPFGSVKGIMVFLFWLCLTVSTQKLRGDEQLGCRT